MFKHLFEIPPPFFVTSSPLDMWRISNLWRRPQLTTLPKDPSLFFGVGRPRTPEQVERYHAMKNTTIESAFPHLAACWVGPSWGTVMLTPHHVAPTCVKSAVWRCSQCLQEFEMSIARFIDQHGTCPLCGKEQRRISSTRNEGPERINGKMSEGGNTDVGITTSPTDATNEEDLELEDVNSLRAPRMTHTNYKSVLHSNPEWEGRNILPMLAQRWELVAEELLHPADTEEQESLLVSPKIDGIRCLIGYNKSQKKLQFFSRSGILLECCHGLVPHAMPLFKADPSLLLDGELFAPHCGFERLSGLVRRLEKFTTQTTRRKQAKLLEYFAFDIMASDQLSSPDAPFSERYRLLKELIPHSGADRVFDTMKPNGRRNHQLEKEELSSRKKIPKLYHVPATLVSPDEVESVLEKACSQGYEGVIIRRPKFPYEHGKRSLGLLKYKYMHDAEYRIVDFLPGNGKFEGGLGAFVCETSTGIRFNATPKTTTKRRLELWAERDRLLGKYLTVQYQELSSQDVPRFPIAKCVRGESEKDWL